MSTQTTCDEDLVRRLPLPLAKIYRRSHSARAKSALELHQAAYYLWEASLKLLGSTAIVAYAERGEHDPELADGRRNRSCVHDYSAHTGSGSSNGDPA